MNLTGITHYSTTTKGIGGLLKKRISDFIVSEITLNGKTLKNLIFGEWEGKKEIEFEPTESKDDTKEYLHFTMEKFNLDTNTALRKITRQCHCSQKRLGYAGMKDKRGITSQRISFWQPNIEKLKKFNDKFISLREPEWSNQRIEIGNHKGNYFEITIRNILLNEKELRKETEECFQQMKKGLANYFGEQRFGGIRQITHRVGREFVNGNFEQAVLLYLTSPSEGEEKEIAIARKNLFKTKDYSKASKEFPSKFRYELAILHHLCKYPKDFIGAFQNLPKHLIYMFTHAYQSYLFNEIINLRIERGIGLEPIEGDVLEDGIVTAPLFGLDTKISEGVPGEIEKEILEKEKINLTNFKIKSFPELSCKGTIKKIKIIPKELKLISIEDDEFFEGKKLKISFSLDKGNYATTVSRELMKNP